MTLHGSIQVNGDVIGRWAARRTTIHTDPDGTALYECEVVMAPWVDVTTFDVRHRYDDGALTLAAKVLAHAAVDRHVDVTGVEVEAFRRWHQHCGGCIEQVPGRVTGVTVTREPTP